MPMTRKTRSKTTPYSLRLTVQTKRAAEKAAEADRRSLASLIEVLLIKHCRERGMLATGRDAATASADLAS
jgi:hypothetical protein